MNENTTIEQMEREVRNARLYVDRMNKAMYGMTWEEHERLHGKENHDRDNERGPGDGDS